MPDKLIVLLEDDPDQSEYFEDALNRAFERTADRPGLIVLDSESAFHEQIGKIMEQRPSLFVLDIMVRWQDIDSTPSVPMPDPAPPDEAGIRCKNLIRQCDTQVPVVIWTVIETDTLPQSAREHCQLLTKSEFGPDKLIARLKES